MKTDNEHTKYVKFLPKQNDRKIDYEQGRAIRICIEVKYVKNVIQMVKIFFS